MRKGLIALAIALIGCTPVTAGTVIASSSFDTYDENWRQGEFDGIEPAGGSPAAIVWNPNGTVTIQHDNYPYAGFLAPESYLGNLTAAIGGTLSFDLADLHNDGQPNGQGIAWTAYVSIMGANGMLIYGGLEDRLPNKTDLSHFSISLDAAHFYTEGNLATGHGPTLGGRAVTDEEFATVMGNVARLAIPADFSSGDDTSTLDNVVLMSAMPEPAGWMTMILGFGAAGALIRKDRARRAIA